MDVIHTWEFMVDDELALFYEDASDQLSFMEEELLNISDHGVNDENMGALFRAMHTIKGTAGMFGFDELVSFTHVAENLLDELRRKKTPFDDDLLQLFLDVKDYTSMLVESNVNGEELSQNALDNQVVLTKKLSSYLEKNTTADSSEEKSDIQELDFSELNDEDSDMWHVSIRFSSDFFTSGMDVLSIFTYFNKIGEILINTPIVDAIPIVEEINPLQTYIGFEMEFQSSCSREDIEEIFEFVEDDVTLFIFKTPNQEAYAELFESYEGLENLLVEAGVYEKIQEDTSAIEEEIVVSEESPKPETLKNENIEIEQIVSKTQSSSSLRVDSYKIDALINQMSEIVIANAKVEALASSSEDNELVESIESLKLLLEDVRDKVMGIRMVAVESSFSKLKRIVNDTARKLSKEIKFEIIGGETELDKTIIEKISDPLVHMLRNSVDHGIEMPDKRESLGKDRVGKIILKAYTDSGMIVIEIIDDGGGINRDLVLDIAKNKGIISEDAHLSDKEIYKLIFAPGFSTASEVTDISGRGVGMDVVKSNIESLRGTLDIDSKINEGSKITIRLPLTLAIIGGFVVQVGDTKYIIPLEMIQECIELTPKMREDMKENSFINLRDKMLPILDIRTHFNEKKYSGLRENIVVVKYANDTVGLSVDELFGEMQTVVKPLGEVFQNVSGLSGGTILGSGEVALVFDIAKLIESKIEGE